MRSGEFEICNTCISPMAAFTVISRIPMPDDVRKRHTFTEADEGLTRPLSVTLRDDAIIVNLPVPCTPVITGEAYPCTYGYRAQAQDSFKTLCENVYYKTKGYIDEGAVTTHMDAVHAAIYVACQFATSVGFLDYPSPSIYRNPLYIARDEINDVLKKLYTLYYEQDTFSAPLKYISEACSLLSDENVLNLSMLKCCSDSAAVTIELDDISTKLETVGLRKTIDALPSYLKDYI